MSKKQDIAPLKRKTGIVAAVDIGTSKICCFIARVANSGLIEIIGIGHQASQGLRNGTIVDLKAAETAIGHAVHTAENMARNQMQGQPLRGVFVNVPGVHAKSQTMNVDIRVSGHEITERDIQRALAKAADAEVSGQEELIHTLPSDFCIDGHHGIKEPRGMYGQLLKVQMTAVTASSPALKNIGTCISANHLEIDGLCAAAYASGLSALVEDEMNLGCTVVDMGGGTTSIGVFLEGKLIFTSAIPVGGIHVTNDIARGLTTSVADAERIKTLYGSAMTSAADDTDLIDVPQLGEDEHTHPNHVPRSLLVGITQPRLEETFELIRARLHDSGYGQVAGRRVVLTGGASQLPGVRELAQLVLDKQVRLGRPLRIKGMAESTSGPAFTTAAGLLLYAAERAEEKKEEIQAQPVKTGTLLERAGQWLKENW